MISEMSQDHSQELEHVVCASFLVRIAIRSWAKKAMGILSKISRFQSLMIIGEFSSSCYFSSMPVP